MAQTKRQYKHLCTPISHSNKSIHLTFNGKCIMIYVKYLMFNVNCIDFFNGTKVYNDLYSNSLFALLFPVLYLISSATFATAV